MPVGRLEVRVASFERRRVERLAQLVDLVPAHAGAPHSRVDLDMERTVATRRPFENAAGVAERRGQLMAVVRIEQSRARRHEHEDGPRDAGRAQLRTFFDRGDAVAPGIELLEGLRD